MALVYKRSGKKAARAYDRSKGMEPNPGVSALTVVSNPSGRRTSRRTSRGVEDNPFQWIEGRGQRHRHVSPEYKSLKSAARWKKRNKGSRARLYPVDERGTIVSRPVDSRLLDNGGSEMPYNIGALKRAMRSNPKKRVKANRTKGGVKVKSRGKRRTTRNKKRSTVRRKSRPTKRNSKRRTSRKPKRNRAKKSSRRRSRKPRRNSKRRSSSRKPKRNSRRRSSKRRSSKRRPPRRNSRRRSSKRRSSKRRAPRRNSRRRSSRRRSSKRRSTRRNRGVRASDKRRSSKRRSSKRRSSKKSKTRYFGKRKVGLTGAEFLDKYLEKGLMPTVAPRYRTGKSRSGIPPVRVYGIPKTHGRLSKRKTSRSTKSRGKHRSRKKARSVGSQYKGRRGKRMKRNSRRRSSKRRSSRRRSTRRNSKRRSSKRRSSKRRSSRRVRKNLLSTTKARYAGRGKYRTGRPVGKTVQVLAYGPGSRTKSGGKLKGYPVYIPGHVIETAAVRRYKGLGGAAKDSHRRAKRRGYRERKKYPKRRVRKNSRRKTSMRKNRRKSRRKSTRRNSRRRSRRRSSRRRRTRRNPKYVVANRRRRRSSKRRRRPRKNQGIYGADIMKDVVTPVLGGTVGFVSARVLSNGLANVEGLRKILDKDKPAAEATNTKIAANVLGIVATLGLAPRVDVIKRNQGALITGMGLALTDRLLGMVTGDAAAYLGEYVTQPLGEYVTQPLGEYVTQPLGAYTDDTLYAAAGLGFPVMEAAAGMGAPVLEAAAGYHEGVDPGNQASIDGMMDGMEGAMYATAGVGETMYATAGLGAEADASLKQLYARNQPPFASIQTPTDLARRVPAGAPYAKAVPDTLVTPEGKGYAGGLFARNLFAGML